MKMFTTSVSILTVDLRSLTNQLSGWLDYGQPVGRRALPHGEPDLLDRLSLLESAPAEAAEPFRCQGARAVLPTENVSASAPTVIGISQRARQSNRHSTSIGAGRRR